jgi:5'-nucleotidase/UDP-sugar diphosphatase
MARRIFLLVALLSLMVATTAARTAPTSIHGAQTGRVDLWLTLLHNNDGESAILEETRDFDPGVGVDLQPAAGVARFATLLQQLRDAALTGRPTVPGAKLVSLTVSSGDNFLAGPEFQASLDKGVPFYDAIAMDLIGYDAIALGNHDFDFGPDVTEDFIRSFTSPVPFLSANLDFSQEPGLDALVDQGRIAASVVVKVRGERIGIIGATTPALAAISSPRDVIVDTDVAGAVQAEVNVLEAAGVNKIILISHLQDVDEDLALAPLLDGVDVMVAGGGDELLANPGDALLPGDTAVGTYPLWATDADGTLVPVVTTAGGYGYVGQLVAGFDSQGNLVVIDESGSGPARVTGGTVSDAVEPDPEVQSQVVDPVAAFVADLATTIVAQTEVPLDSRRGDAAVVAGATVINVPGERVSETNLGDLATDSLLWQATQLAPTFGMPTPDIALQNGGGIRQPDVLLLPDATPSSPVDVTRLDINGQFPFPNFVSIVPGVSVQVLKEILENAISRVDAEDGRFAHIAGFSFEWDSTQPARLLDVDGNLIQTGSRIRHVELDDGTVLVDAGVIVDPTASVNIATIDFLARGGDFYPFAGAPFTTLGVTYEQAVVNYLTDVLGGLITAAQYPDGGAGRVNQIS